MNAWLCDQNETKLWLQNIIKLHTLSQIEAWQNYDNEFMTMLAKQA